MSAPDLIAFRCDFLRIAARFGVIDDSIGVAYRFLYWLIPLVISQPDCQFSTSLSRSVFAALWLLFVTVIPGVPFAQDEVEESIVEPWTQADTRLANHYMQILQKDPQYGNVLNLLWDLYAKKNQTPLLLGYFEGIAKPGVPVASLIYAHLLRKNDQIDEARDFYDIVLDEDEANLPALKALAEIADQQDREGKALSLYTRLAALMPATDEEGLAVHLRLAALYQQRGQPEEAVAIWNELLRLHASDQALRGQITSLLLESGETESAIQALVAERDSGDPRRKLDALIELNRLYEFISDFEGAVASAKEGMGLLHFRNHQYGQLFSRLVRVHERFDRLDGLEADLLAVADQEKASEKALYDLAEFYRLSANLEKEESALSRLVAILPKQLEYRIRLTELQMRNDHYALAAATLDEVLTPDSNPPLHLILLRSEIALRGESREAAADRLSQHLDNHSVSNDERSEVLAFARTHYLDELVERLLKKDAMETGTKTGTSPIDLARFLHERGRTEEARATLDDYVEAAEDGSLERGRRLQETVLILRDLGEEEAAIVAIEEALKITPNNDSLLLARAEIFVDQKEIEAAIEQYEVIWNLRETFADRADIDQRIFSLMRGHYSTAAPVAGGSSLLNSKGEIRTNAEFRRLAMAASQSGRSADEPPPQELLAYYDGIKKTANRSKATSDRYRAAWWAFKLQQNQECYFQLKSANEEAGAPVLEVEEMLLELAELNERPTLMVDHLSTLIDIDPENADEYRQRRAEMRFELGFEDEAVRELKILAAKPDASLSTLSTLARVYERQGSSQRQSEVWKRAYREANVFEKRSIIKQLSSVLIETGKPEEALEAQIELLARESDPVQRRKQLDTQLTLAKAHFLLDWMLEEYKELIQQHPFDRFYPEALARVYRAAGNDSEAFAMMKKAYYMSNQNENLLGELGELADQLGDLKSAIYYRRQLLARGEGDTLENWQSLVDMLEKDLRVGEADLLRRRLESKFGTDPDFLTGLAAFYVKGSQLTDADRVFRRLVELREWDLEARFQLALIQRARGEFRESFESFKALIAKTDSVAYPVNFGEQHMPLIRTELLDADQKVSHGTELDKFVYTVESYPFVGGDLQDEIADRLQEPHSEFRYLPKTDHLIRLRSIEEAASLAAELGVAGQWKGEWLDDEIPLVERLWAMRYSGAMTEFAGLLGEYADSGSHFDQLFLAYGHILSGDRGRLDEWMEQENVLVETPQARSLYVGIAALLLLKDNAEDPQFDAEFIYDLLEELPMTQTVALHFFTELRKEARFEMAYQVGESLLKNNAQGEGLSTHGNFVFVLSQVAGWAGREAERADLLDRSLAIMAEQKQSRTPDQFFTALTEKLSLFSDDAERALYLKRLSDDYLLRHGSYDSDDLEREILFEMAGRRDDEVIRKLKTLASRQIATIRPRDDDEEQIRFQQSKSWQRMSAMLHYYEDRIQFNAERGQTFVDAIGGHPLAPPSEPSVIAAFEQFKIDQVCVELNWLNAPERLARVEQVHSLFHDRESTMELGKTLEQNGFHREAISVYEVEALQRDRDYAPLQGLFEACLEALEPSAGIDIIRRIDSRDFPAPPGLTADYLNEQNARFLLISRDIERLSQLSRFPASVNDKIPVTARSHLPFQDALVEAYRQRGDDEPLLRLLRHMRNKEYASHEQLLLGADLLRKAERHEEAFEWLQEVLDASPEPEHEKTAGRSYLALLREQGWPDNDWIVEFAKTSLSRQPASFVMEISDALVEAGASDQATSLLQLLYRNSSRLVQRTELNLDLLKLSGGEITVDELSARLEMLFHDFEYEVEPKRDRKSFPQVKPEMVSPNGFRIAEWIAGLGEDEEVAARVAESLAMVYAPAKSHWLKQLLLAHLNGNLEAEVIPLFADAGPEIESRILETLPGFGAVGIEVAQAMVNESAVPGTSLFTHEPVRQISFFHRIGDRSRLIEVCDQIVEQSQSDIFHQNGLDSIYPTLMSNQALPALLAELGETGLASRMFRQFHGAISHYQWNHEWFLEAYARFLIENGDFDEASLLLERVLRKTIQFDLRLLVKFYEATGKLDRWEEESAGLFLSEGQRVLIRDWRTALAEGREMVESKNSW